ncbi:MAG: hypothetical protein HKP37_07380 [Boseongicola sp.]|nr:hypothetical protein [Boseongicola sp.]
MSEISIYTPYVLFSLPFFVAAFVLIKARLDARRDEHTADYERFIWPDESDEPEAEDRPIQRRYVSYST